jgi:hypothetical protein
MGEGFVDGKPLNISYFSSHMIILNVELDLQGGRDPDKKILVAIVNMIATEERFHDGLDVINADHFGFVHARLLLHFAHGTNIITLLGIPPALWKPPLRSLLGRTG